MAHQEDAVRRARTRTEIEGFAKLLSAARQEAGEPSFRKMAATSGCISHTTLHEAVQGNRFPSWSTTEQFATALHRDPADFKPQWEAVNALLEPAQPPLPTPASHQPPEPVEDRPAVANEPDGPTRRRPPVWLIAAALALVLAVLVGSLVVWRERSGVAHPAAGNTAALLPGGIPLSPGGAHPSAYPSPTACPVADEQREIAPRVAGDHASYGADLTVPDCSTVAPGQTLHKKFTLRNSGSVAWKGRSVVRVDIPFTERSCTSELQTSVPDTRPGGEAVIEVEVTAPRHKGLCVARWMMADGGHWSFPGQRSFKTQVWVR
ncbi:hypothetical protein HJ588_07170 [Flexivirga sp. ID2601S]|uniref:Nbr1 FW domain-containing protein n=1 Tax=Flexivirga aerilata TaxID=1656889 RepID=A0A849AGL8_9MICO|nr:NBR1-Ig-like domain-containing protein [Flexivirga aerilata]NNG39053.1 hypothetical protein [Flexivirga aerilata]